jgi:hypothetical protein
MITKFTRWMLVALITGSGLFAQTQPKESAKISSNEQLVVPLSSPDKPFTLKVSLTTGSIKVTTYEGKDIVIDVISPNRKREDDDNGSGMRRIPTGGGYEISAHEDNNTVSVRSGNPNQSVDLSIRIPQDSKQISLHTVNGGHIEGTNLKGELEVTNVNGGIHLTNITGSVVANTVNGELLVTFAAVDPKAPMAFSTLNGNVDVTLPADTKGNMKLKSDRGDIYSDFDMNIDKSEPRVQKSESAGMYKLVLEDWVYGKLNGGGPEILMKTMQGNIYIRKGK